MFCSADDETEKSEVFVNSCSLVCVISLALVYHSSIASSCRNRVRASRAATAILLKAILGFLMSYNGIFVELAGWRKFAPAPIYTEDEDNLSRN
jgi:cell division protein FtsW (lipid II flippase)